MMMLCIPGFFCKQKTAYEMSISDRSSAVNSSDLAPDRPRPAIVRAPAGAGKPGRPTRARAAPRLTQVNATHSCPAQAGGDGHLVSADPAAAPVLRDRVHRGGGLRGAGAGIAASAVDRKSDV